MTVSLASAGTIAGTERRKGGESTQCAAIPAVMSFYPTLRQERLERLASNQPLSYIWSLPLCHADEHRLLVFISAAAADITGAFVYAGLMYALRLLARPVPAGWAHGTKCLTD